MIKLSVMFKSLFLALLVNFILSVISSDFFLYFISSNHFFVEIMSNSDTFCLKWNEFEKNVSSTLKDFKDDEDFFDVTLACEEEQVQAHKLVLSACSPFFRHVLKKHRPSAPCAGVPLLYLKGVR